MYLCAARMHKVDEHDELDEHKTQEVEAKMDANNALDEHMNWTTTMAHTHVEKLHERN